VTNQTSVYVFQQPPVTEIKRSACVTQRSLEPYNYKHIKLLYPAHATIGLRVTLKCRRKHPSMFQSALNVPNYPCMFIF